MRGRTISPLLIMLLLTLRAWADEPKLAEPEPGEPQPAQRERLIIVPSNVPAWDMARALPQLLAGTENVSVRSAAGSRVIVVEAPSAEVPHITKLVREIDRPRPMITVSAVSVVLSTDDRIAASRIQTGFSEFLSDAIAELEKKEMLRVVDRVRLTTLDEQEAYVQVGPKVRRNASGPVRSSLIVRLIPRQTEEGSVLMDLLFEESELAESDAGNKSIVRRAQSVIEVLPGESVVLAGVDEQPDKPNNSDWRLVISATVKQKPGAGQ